MIKSPKFLVYPMMFLLFFATIGCSRLDASDSEISADLNTLKHNDSASCHFSVKKDTDALNLEGSLSLEKGALRFQVLDEEQEILYDKKFEAAAFRSVSIPLTKLETEKVYTFQIISLDESEEIELTLFSNQIISNVKPK